MIHLAILGATAVLFVLALSGLPRPVMAGLLTPAGLLLAFLALATGLVPLLWLVGIAEPWDEIRDRPLAAAGTTLLCFLFFALGIMVSRTNQPLRTSRLQTEDGKLTTALLIGLAIGVAGYLVLAFLSGGPAALLHSLGDRRELLAGTGPVRSLMIVAAVACIYGAWHGGKNATNTVLTWACGLTYAVLTLATGSRYQTIVMLIALVYVRAHRDGVSSRLLRRVGFAILAVAPLSTIYGVVVRLRLTYGVDVDAVDTTTTQSAISSSVGPFVRGGLDTIRTTGVTPSIPEQLTFSPDYLLGSLGNLIPRALWPEKPPGAATQFSMEFFPQRWANGTGVPPSLFAESLVTFGRTGGLIMLAVFAFAFARFSARLMKSESVFARLLAPLIAADSIQLGKGGSDGFLRTLFLHLLAVVAMTVVAKTSATVASWNDLPPAPVDVTRDARLRRRHKRPPRATLRPG